MRAGVSGGGFLRGIGLFLVVSSFLLAAGCHWGDQGKTEVPLPPDERQMREAARGTETPREEAFPAASVEPRPEVPAEAPAPPRAVEEPAPTETKAPEKDGAGLPVPVPALPDETPAAAAPGVAVPREPPLEEEKPEADRTPAEPRDRKPTAGPRPSAPVAGPANGPAWARGAEELVYRVEFLGMTMGYARFTFKGRVISDGKEAYHLNVRAWTSDFLSVIYPINDSIDYFLDVNTLAPIRQEYTKYGRKEKDDIAFYDQEKGKIVYRYKHNGEIRKKVDVPPDVHDPVSAAYYFRTRDLGLEGHPRNVYAGRKLWSISTRTLGMERVETPGGTVDAVVVSPIIKRDGRQESKGDLKMWMTNDARHVPVKIYAKFKKIKMWTLTAELMQGREGG